MGFLHSALSDALQNIRHISKCSLKYSAVPDILGGSFVRWKVAMNSKKRPLLLVLEKDEDVSLKYVPFLLFGILSYGREEMEE